MTRFRDRQAGTLRLTVPRALGAWVLRGLAPRFQRAYPDMSLDMSLDDGEVDLLEQGYDAGIRLGQSVVQGMVAVRLTGELAWSVVGAPAYFACAGRPLIPEDLVVNDTGLIADFARSGLGLAYLPDIEVAHDLSDRRLERVLEAFIAPTSGLFLYFAARTQSQPKLRAFIDMAVANWQAGKLPDKTAPRQEQDGAFPRIDVNP